MIEEKKALQTRYSGRVSIVRVSANLSLRLHRNVPFRVCRTGERLEVVFESAYPRVHITLEQLDYAITHGGIAEHAH